MVQKLQGILSLGHLKGRPSWKRSIQLLKENIQHFKTIHFLTFFFYLWVMFALLVPDPNTVGLNQSGSGSNTSATRRLQSYLNVFFIVCLWERIQFMLTSTRRDYSIFFSVLSIWKESSSVEIWKLGNICCSIKSLKWTRQCMCNVTFTSDFFMNELLSNHSFDLKRHLNF